MQISDLLTQTGAGIRFSWSEPERAAAYADIPTGLDPQLRLLLKILYPQGLYSHQSKSVQASLSGKHVGICTSTASGKSLCFLLPAVNELLADRNTRAIFLYPTKALANDQTKKLAGMLSPLKLRGLLQKLDGDVLGEKRKKAIAGGRILISTPDVLHTSILRLNREPGYADFFRNLKYVVIDECHVYNGAFGSNMAYVLRRLRQVCGNSGANPSFILASATTGNPSEHLEQLTGLKEITVISEQDNGSPSRGRDFFLAEPPAVIPAVYLAQLVEKMCAAGKRFLIFCHSRQDVERFHMSLSGLNSSLREQVMPYRAGYEASDRISIENALRNRVLSGVFCTSALELGVDLPDMDICLMLGLPGTKISFTQRAGRVGRSKKGSVVILKTGGAQDEYYFSHPLELLQKRLEPLSLHLENRQVILGHYACARLESGDFENPQLNEHIFGNHFKKIEERIRDFDFPDEVLYHHSPHFEVQIRSINDPSYSIILGKDGSDPAIGAINYSQILREAYPGAIYGHMGRRYRVDKISYSKKQVFISAKCPPGSTRPLAHIFVKPRPGACPDSGKTWPGVTARRCFISVIERVDGYIENIHGKKAEVPYRQPLMRYFVTSGVDISLQGLDHLSHGAVLGLATALENTYPLVFPCAPEDFGIHAWARNDGEGHIFFFDNAAGGLGLSWPVVDFFEQMAVVALKAVENCPNCGMNENSNTGGCVKCIASTRWYGHTLKGNRQETIRLARELLSIIERQPAQSCKINSLAKQQEAFSPIKNPAGFGQTMLAQGSLVFTGRCQEGLITSSKPFLENNSIDRIYEILVDGKTYSFLGRSLSLIQGQLERWCTNCGEESIDMLAGHCPVCGEQL